MQKSEKNKFIVCLALIFAIFMQIGHAAANGPEYLEKFEFNLLFERMDPKDIVYVDPIESYKMSSFGVNFIHRSEGQRVGSYTLKFDRRNSYEYVDDAKTVGLSGSFYLEVQEGTYRKGYAKIDCGTERLITFPAPQLKTNLSFCALPVGKGKLSKYYRFRQISFGNDSTSSIHVGSSQIDPSEFKMIVSKLRYYLPR